MGVGYASLLRFFLHSGTKTGQLEPDNTTLVCCSSAISVRVNGLLVLLVYWPEKGTLEETLYGGVQYNLKTFRKILGQAQRAEGGICICFGHR